MAFADEDKAEHIQRLRGRHFDIAGAVVAKLQAAGVSFFCATDSDKDSTNGLVRARAIGASDARDGNRIIYAQAAKRTRYHLANSLLADCAKMVRSEENTSELQSRP